MLNMDYKTSRGKQRRKSLWPWVGQRIFRYNPKSMIHNKKYINQTLPKWKPFALGKTRLENEKAGHPQSKYLQITCPTKDLCLPYVGKNHESSAGRKPHRREQTGKKLGGRFTQEDNWVATSTGKALSIIAIGQMQTHTQRAPRHRH